jgi:hypothetical protein
MCTAESVFVNHLRSPGIDSQPGRIDSSVSIPGLLKQLPGPRTPPLPPHLGSLYTMALLVSQDRRHLFVTPYCNGTRTNCCCSTCSFTSSQSGGHGDGWREGGSCVRCLYNLNARLLRVKVRNWKKPTLYLLSSYFASTLLFPPPHCKATIPKIPNK